MELLLIYTRVDEIRIMPIIWISPLHFALTAYLCSHPAGYREGTAPGSPAGGWIEVSLENAPSQVGSQG